MTSYQAQVVNVNNNYQKQDKSLPFLLSVAQWSGESIIILDQEMDVTYLNNKLGSFSGARSRDTKNLDGVARYMRNIYKNADVIYREILKCYRDYKPRFLSGVKFCGDTVYIKLIPVLDNVNFRGVILMGNLDAKIRSGDSKRE